MYLIIFTKDGTPYEWFLYICQMHERSEKWFLMIHDRGVLRLQRGEGRSSDRAWSSIQKSKALYNKIMKIETNIATFTVIIEKDSDGYFARCHELQGCYASGASYEEAIENIKEVIALHIEDRTEKLEHFISSESSSVSLTTVALEVPAHVS